jgi:hypothetical protein
MVMTVTSSNSSENFVSFQIWGQGRTHLGLFYQVHRLDRTVRTLQLHRYFSRAKGSMTWREQAYLLSCGGTRGTIYTAFRLDTKAPLFLGPPLVKCALVVGVKGYATTAGRPAGARYAS